MNSGISCGKDILERLTSGSAHVQEQLTFPPTKEKRAKVIVLAGPTSCGKSALSMMLAGMISGEIISADSLQVYKGMDIGTAKASKRDRIEVPHHMIDIRDLWEDFNVVDFYHESKFCIDAIHSAQRVPIVVGGSGFYIHSLLYGPPSGPPSVPEVRERLEAQFDRLGPDAMFERLSQLDIDYAKTITRHDRQKIIRALEIIEITGSKVSQFSWKNRRIPKNYDFRCWFLNRPKTTLYHRIEKRCDKMLSHGLLEEVSRLEKTGLRENPSASQAIGYRQSLDFLNGKQDKQHYLEFVDNFMRDSRRYAKRQLTWFRREPMFQWLDLDLHDPETAIDLIINDLEAR